MKKLYRIISVVVYLCALPILASPLFGVVTAMRTAGQFSFFLAPAFLLIVCTLLIKAARFYFIVLEKRMGLLEFTQTYLGTTLISVLFPFKSGELFRAFVYGEKLRQIKVGILLVLIDRYFDTVPLVVLLLGIVIRGGNASSIVWVLAAGMVLITMLYVIFPSSYLYLNHFLIANEDTKKSLIALELLKKVNDGYMSLKELIRGREILLLFLSACAWVSEYSALFCLAKGLNLDFGPGSFLLYMSSILSGQVGNFGRLYIGINSALLAVSGVLMFAIRLVYRKKERR